MKSDIEIAQEATMRPIQEIGAELGIQPEELIFYGHYKAKLSKELEQRLQDKPDR